MKYIVPVPDITLYEDGFKKFDLLDRGEKGKQLSELVERIDDPLVIAIDGPWGSGKSFFLKCWVGAHSVENEGSAKTVYFDAFENDFLDDPLLSLTSAITDRMGQNGNVGEGWAKVRTAAAKL
jgi:predicted AAA+ superfamily ATPase